MIETIEIVLERATTVRRMKSRAICMTTVAVWMVVWRRAGKMRNVMLRMAIMR